MTEVRQTRLGTRSKQGGQIGQARQGRESSGRLGRVTRSKQGGQIGQARQGRRRSGRLGRVQSPGRVGRDWVGQAG